MTDLTDFGQVEREHRTRTEVLGIFDTFEEARALAALRRAEYPDIPVTMFQRSGDGKHVVTWEVPCEHT